VQSYRVNQATTHTPQSCPSNEPSHCRSQELQRVRHMLAQAYGVELRVSNP
jgi:hypothetical protein